MVRLRSVALQVQDCLQSLIRESFSIVYRISSDIVCPCGDVLGHLVRFLPLVPRAAVEVRSVHRPDVLGYLLLGLIDHMLVIVQVVVQAIDLLVDLLNDEVHILFRIQSVRVGLDVLQVGLVALGLGVGALVLELLQGVDPLLPLGQVPLRDRL